MNHRLKWFIHLYGRKAQRKEISILPTLPLHYGVWRTLYLIVLSHWDTSSSTCGSTCGATMWSDMCPSVTDSTEKHGHILGHMWLHITILVELGVFLYV